MEDKNYQSEIDKLFDEDNFEPIVMVDEEGNEVKFNQVAVIPEDEKIYVILEPASGIEDVEDGEVFIFTIETIDDEEALVLVNDDEIVNRVFESYLKLCEKE